LRNKDNEIDEGDDNGEVDIVDDDGDLGDGMLSASMHIDDEGRSKSVSKNQSKRWLFGV
jgi:hypothetical protein